MTDHAAPLAGKRVLVLDDEFLIALDIQNILEAAGASVVGVVDVGAALEALRDDQDFDLAIVDVKLGAAATSTAVTGRLIERGIPFVFLTGMRSDDVRVDHPDVPVIEKPYVAELLIEALRKVLAGRRA